MTLKIGDIVRALETHGPIVQGKVYRVTIVDAHVDQLVGIVALDGSYQNVKTSFGGALRGLQNFKLCLTK
jgi:hypothetical protein